jgi:hypothetical protein
MHSKRIVRQERVKAFNPTKVYFTFYYFESKSSVLTDHQDLNGSFAVLCVFPAMLACIIAAHGIVEKYRSVAMASWHRDTRYTSKCGMFLLVLLQWALMLE